MKSLVLALALAAAIPSPAQTDLLDRGYRQMYNLDFEGAHDTFRDYEKLQPADPLGPVSNAAAYLFSEFDRLSILQSEFFVSNSSFLSMRRPQADATAKADFNRDLQRSETLATSVLNSAPDDANALLASVMRIGLRADYMSLIEKHNMAALTEVKQSRAIAERLLSKHPDCYDGYLAVGLENYLLSLKAAPIRWILRAGGAETDKETGIEKLRLTADKGRFLKPYARLLLAVAALRDKNKPEAGRILTWLSTEFPRNRLYREELARLQ
jgi:hypothetical protein